MQAVEPKENLMKEEQQDEPIKLEMKEIEDCFKILKVSQNDTHVQYFIPTCVQFKIKNFTKVDFSNLTAQINGVLCINFLIFTNNKHDEKYYCDRLYWNDEELEKLEKNRRKKIERSENFVPVVFNKDTNVKLPSTRTKDFQIQSFKSRITYGKPVKERPKMEGWRIFHVIRKEFKVQIIKNGSLREFLSPFNFINLDLTLSLQHMKAVPFKQDNYPKDFTTTRKIGFNILRIQEPFTQPHINHEERVKKLLPMIAYSSEESFGKYDVVQTALQAYSHDERELMNLLNEKEDKQLLFRDHEPTQLDFKPFKYAVFKIPLFRYPIVDMMTIFIPLWLLSFISIYIFFQTTEIMNRIVNVAALMIAYAAIQPIVRENLPDATTLTLVDVLIYMQLLINILFLVRTIDVRSLQDNPDPTIKQQLTYSNITYDRWDDKLFITSIVISLTNFLIVLLLILCYLVRKQSYKGPAHKSRRIFAISKQQNWTLKLLMQRSFARYRQTLQFEDD